MRFQTTPFWLGALSEDLAYAVRQRTASWLGTVLRASALVLAASGVAALVTKSLPVWWIYGAFASVTLVALALDMAKRTHAAGVLLAGGFWLIATVTVFLLGGVRSPGTFVYLPIVLTAGLFWSWRAAAGLTVATLAVEIGALWLDTSGLLPTPVQAPTAGPLFRIFAASLTMTAVLLGVALHSLRGALADVRRYALRTEELLVGAPHVIAVFDRLGVVLAVNPTVYEVTGYLPVELVGRHISRIELFASERRFAVEEFRKIAARGGDAGRALRLLRKDGSVIWVEVRTHSLVLGSGESMTRVVVHDVTRRKLAEERQVELEKLVERGKRLEAMGLLVGGVTHDFNNLLTVILSVSAVLDAQFSEDSPVRELVRDIKDAAVRASTLARQLLDARPGADPGAIDVGRQIEGLRPILSRLVGDAIEVVVRTDDGPCIARVDAVQLEQIAVNLAVNARDAMPNGGKLSIEISRGVESPDAGQGSRPDDDGAGRFVEISVVDSGVGMDDATRKRMFEPFYSTKGKGGTGLGLASVDGIVSRLGGHIRVDSEPGHGTRVRVLLPEVVEDDRVPSVRPSDGDIRLA